jgi:hypothetical protein
MYLDELEESVVQAIIQERLNYSQTSHTNQSPSFGKMRTSNYLLGSQQIQLEFRHPLFSNTLKVWYKP